MHSAPHIVTAVMARNMLRDVLPCSDFDHVSGMLGFVPSSEEVAEAEHCQSHARCHAIAPLGDVIEEMSLHIGGLMAGVAAGFHGELPEGTAEMYQSTAHVAAFAVIAQLVEHGYLKVRA